MYHCCNIRKLLRFLVIDMVVLILAAICTTVGKFYAASNRSPDGIFLPILMYHSITEGPENEFRVTPETLEADLQYLSQHGYQSVSAQQLVDYTNGIGTLPEHPVMITFDDGFYNNLSLALPILEQYQMCAIVSTVGIFTEMLAPDAPHVDAYSYLTWEDLRTMLQSDWIELGNHTYDMHSNGSRCGCRKMDWETEEDYHTFFSADVQILQNRCREELNQVPIVFAYPYGFVCQESNAVLKDAGFLLTLTCLEKPNYITKDPNCLYDLNRYNRSGFLSTETYMQRILSES